MSESWFKEWATAEGVEVVRRGRKPGVRGSSVEEVITRSRVRRVTHPLLRQIDPELPIHGVDLLDAARSELGSDGQIARSLGVTAGTVSRWRLDGVPDRRLRQLAEILGWSDDVLPLEGLTARGRSVRQLGPRTPTRF
jgi:hypothetical protein